MESQTTLRSRYDATTILFWMVWVIATSIAFWVGWRTGGQDFNATGLARIPHNLYYMGFVGVVQSLVLLYWLRRSQSGQIELKRNLKALLLAWPFVSALGFTLGVFVGYRVTQAFSLNAIAFGIVFGVCMGICISSVQWLALRQTGLPALRWFACSFFGWLIGEIISSLGYRSWIIPLTGATISAFTGLALIWLLTNPVKRQSSSARTAHDTATPYLRAER